MIRGNHCLFNYVADFLTTELFILTLSRFLARRRHVKITACGNGRNFIGGEFELRALVDEFDSKIITQDLNSKNITWKFNPTLSPLTGVYKIREVSITCNIHGKNIYRRNLANIFIRSRIHP